MLTEKQIKMKLSEIAREKMNEGLYLSFTNVMSSDYKTMLVLEDVEGNKYGLGLKIIRAKSFLDPETAIIQYGKLQEYGLFDFEDEESTTIEKYCLYNNRYYKDGKETEELKEKIEYRRKFNPYTRIWHRFEVKNLNIKGLKRTKSKIEVIRKKTGYTILKDNKEVKQVNFA